MASYQKTLKAQRPTRLDGAREDKTGKVRIKVKLGRVRETTVAVEEQQVLHIPSVFVALVIKQPLRMRRIILSPVACPALQYFSTLPRKRRNFRKKKVNKIDEHKMCFHFLYNFCLI
jgi:hypothetical protein